MSESETEQPAKRMKITNMTNVLNETPPHVEEDNEEVFRGQGRCPIRIARISEEFRTIGKGSLQSIRYEILFGVNDKIELFDGVDTHDEEAVRESLRAISNNIVQHFDNRIRRIESTVNMVESGKWIILRSESHSDASCLNQSRITCHDAWLADSNLPSCDVCYFSREIKNWNDRAKELILKRSDPRLCQNKMEWRRLVERFGLIWVKLEEKEIVSTMNWPALANITRTLCMFLLTLELNEIILRGINNDKYESFDLLALMTGNHYHNGQLTIVMDNIDRRFDQLFKLDPDTDDSVDAWKGMTQVLGLNFSRNELDVARYWGNSEEDEYIQFEYTSRTRSNGTIFGRLLAGRKRFLFNPLLSDVIDTLLQTEKIERVVHRLREMGVQAGQNIIIPTRKIHSKDRTPLWNRLSDWPECTSFEKTERCAILFGLRGTVPSPFVLLLDHLMGNQSAVSPIEFI